MSGFEFTQFITHDAEQLKPFAFNLTRDNESAKDLYQETVYRALANREKYNPGTNIKAWMFTIMRNIFINDYRRKARHNTVFSINASEYLIDTRPNAIDNDGENHLIMKEILSAMSTLPEIFKTPFQMYIDGYKYNEIAFVLREPLGTIKSRIHFARKILKEQIRR